MANSESGIGQSKWSVLIPITVAFISATALLAGYGYEKRAERDFEIHKKRQEIYTQFIINFSEKVALIRQIRRDPDMPRPTKDNVETVDAWIVANYPALDRAFNDASEIGALMAVYGTDEAIRAAVRFNEAALASLDPNSTVKPDGGQLMRDLRLSLFPETNVSADDVNMLIGR